jgi:predicted LPLAT superfamily acyltransferase
MKTRHPLSSTRAAWRKQRERSNIGIMKLMCWISLTCGRKASRVLLGGITLYFLLFSPTARQASRNYLGRILDHAGWKQLYQHFFCFACTIHDRIYLAGNRAEQFDLDIDDQIHLPTYVASQGAILMGAHMGSFDVLYALSRTRPELKVCLVMYEENARKLNRILAAINPGLQHDIIALGQIDTMIRIRDRLKNGYLVGILADRTLNDETGKNIPFLGTAAHFPCGPFRLAALLRCRVVFMAGLYLGGNRYSLHFEELADFSHTLPEEKEHCLTNAMDNYVRAIEKYCRLAPYNWFNFYDFWQSQANDGDGHDR